jgi:hypothetical protein
MADKTMENLLIFGGLGLAAWWAYETYFATPATTATPASSPAASSIATSAPASTPVQTVTSCPVGYTLTNGACVPNPRPDVTPVTAPLNYSEALREAIAQNSNVSTVNRTTDPGAATKANSALSGLGALVRLYGR